MRLARVTVVRPCLKHSCNTSTQEAEDSLGYCSETLSKRGRGGIVPDVVLLEQSILLLS